VSGKSGWAFSGNLSQTGSKGVRFRIKIFFKDPSDPLEMKLKIPLTPLQKLFKTPLSPL
jgi:hypothetical protein